MLDLQDQCDTSRKAIVHPLPMVSTRDQRDAPGLAIAEATDDGHKDAAVRGIRARTVNPPSTPGPADS